MKYDMIMYWKTQAIVIISLNKQSQLSPSKIIFVDMDKLKIYIEKLRNYNSQNSFQKKKKNVERFIQSVWRLN